MDTVEISPSESDGLIQNVWLRNSRFVTMGISVRKIKPFRERVG